MIAETHAAPLRLLLITPRLEVEALVRKLVNGCAPRDLALDRVPNHDSAAARVRETSYDAVLLDGGAGDDAGLPQLRQAVGAGVLAGPFLLLADRIDRTFERAAIEAGAADALAIEQLSAALFERAIGYAVARRQAEVQLAALQLFDPVTGLARQPLFWETLALAVKRAHRHRDHLAVLLVHVDGLAAPPRPGDQVQLLARTVAGRLTNCLRASDTVARFDHDQFVVLVEGMPRAEDVQIVAEKIIKAATDPIDLAGRGLVLAVSMGIAMYPAGALGAEGLIHDAVNAMLYAREKGGNAFHFH
jgi:diguanylate cyclase (GGDEF)-like protein